MRHGGDGGAHAAVGGTIGEVDLVAVEVRPFAPYFFSSVRSIARTSLSTAAPIAMSTLAPCPVTAMGCKPESRASIAHRLSCSPPLWPFSSPI